MKLTSDHLRRLVDAEDPVGAVWEQTYDLWSAGSDDLSTHYEREAAATRYERTLLDVYAEFYEELARRCVTEAALPIPEDGATVVMDALSVREAPLLAGSLRDEGYGVSVGHSYSTVPSETGPFRERVGYTDLKRRYPSATVKTPDPSLDGDERLVWCRYPDALIENIQEGGTQLSTIEEAYRTTEATFRRILAALDADRVLVTSDHGYVRLDAGHTFYTSDAQTERLREVFSGRSVSVGEVDASDLVEAGLVTEADGYYMPVGRYTWPARGKYSVYQHGGVSIHECLTPHIEITQ